MAPPHPKPAPLRTMTGPYGSLYTVHDLPHAKDVVRWTKSKKTLVFRAMLNGLLTCEEIFERYGISADELKEWGQWSKPEHERASKNLAHLISLTTRKQKSPRAKPTHTAQFGDMQIDFEKRTISIAESCMSFTPLQYRLIEGLAMRPDQIVTSAELISHAYSHVQTLPNEKLVDTVICVIRKNIAKVSAKEYIKTVWGRGYMIPSQPD